MSNPFEVIKWARGQELPQAQKLILLVLTTYADKSNACHPGQNRLAEDAGMSVRSVRSAVKALEESGHIWRKARFLSNGNRTSDSYVLNFGHSPTTTPPANTSGGQAEDSAPSDQSPPANPARPPANNDTHHRQNLPGNRPVELPVEQRACAADATRPEVSQEVAVIQGELVPAQEPEPSKKSPEQLAAEDAYEKTGKAFAFIPVRQIAKWLIHDRGLSAEMASKAIVMVYEMGKPITKQVLGQLIDGHIRTNGNSRPTTSDRINDTLAMGQELQAMLDQQRSAS